jgi:hypothetical protein
MTKNRSAPDLYVDCGRVAKGAELPIAAARGACDEPTLAVGNSGRPMDFISFNF